MQFLRALFIFEAVCLFFAFSDSSPVVITNIGTISGLRQSVARDDGVLELDVYLGIPYAKPPTGNLRFAKPVPHENFDGTFEATQMGASCAQIAMPPFPQPPKMSEDCLFLNVFAPVNRDEPSGLPVMVFIHGGGYSMGSADIYVGNTLATHGNVIVVTLNYRLGLFGFFSTGDEHAPGNLALWDQRLALQWINQNIGPFGGDTERVTVFGESAGSMSTFYHALYPPNKGLFQRIIAQSGTPSTVYGSYDRDVMTSARVVAEAMNCPIDTSVAMVQCLRALDLNTILQIFTLIMKDPLNMPVLKHYPYKDNDFIKIDLHEITKLTSSEHTAEVEFFQTIDVLSGFNEYEGILYASMFIPNLEEFRPNRDAIKFLLPMIFNIVLQGDALPDVILDMIISEYTDWSDPYNPETIRKQFLKIFGDITIGVGTVEYLRVHANTSTDVNSYMYHYRPAPTIRIIPAPSWIQSANHGDEVAYVFGWDESFLQVIQHILGSMKAPQDWEYRLSVEMMNYWTNFAKTGNPNSPAKVKSEWSKYKLGEEKYLELNKYEHVTKQRLYGREVNFWLNTVPAVEQALRHGHDPSSPFMGKREGTCDANGDCDEG